jgi:hypothetical protein
MKRWALLLFAACIPSPPDLCRRGVDLECTRQFECQTDAIKMSDAFRGGWGTTLDECRTKVAAQAQCDLKVTQDDLCVGEYAGLHFDLSKASQCSSDRRALSCADFLDPAKMPQSCDERCH